MAAGAAWLLERVAEPPRNGFVALTYHRVDEPDARPWLLPTLLSATPEGFEAQIRALLRRNRPIGLTDVLAARRRVRSLPRRAVLLTFDDAYRDFQDHAWPILHRLGVPAALFVPTAYPDAPEERFWWDRLWQAVLAAPDDRADTPIGPLDLRTELGRRSAARALVDHHKSLDHDEAIASVDVLTRQLARCGATGADSASREPVVLGWDDLRRLAAAGVDVAVHSRTHPLLTRVDPARLEAELRGARDELERELGDAAFGSVLAYPSGRHDDETRAVLVRLAFDLAFTTERGMNKLGASDPLALRRINVGLRAGPELVRAQVGFYTLRYRTRGV